MKDDREVRIRELIERARQLNDDEIIKLCCVAQGMQLALGAGRIKAAS